MSAGPDAAAADDRGTPPASAPATGAVPDPATASRGGRPGPLAGIRVLDLSTVLAGPYCAMLLGDLGADVIKVEPPDGDPTRRYGPPVAHAPATAPEHDRSTYFLAANRNKRGIVLDLRSADGCATLGRLVERSDVLVENFRPGALARLGLPDAELARRNPALVHLAITGYGSDGPDADRPGFDLVIQAVSGLMSITGAPDADGGTPTKVGVAVTDLATGMLGAVHILAALRARDEPAGPEAGRGRRIDLPLLDATLGWLANQATAWLDGGVVPGRLGNAHPGITPYAVYPTAAGEIVIAVGSERQWARFCDAIGAPALALDPRFRTNVERVAHRDALGPILAGILAGRSAAAWADLLAAAEVPVARVRDIAEAFADPGILARGMVVTVEHSTLGPVRLPGIPAHHSHDAGSIRRPPPALGEHTAEVLAELAG
ncbi:MAG: CaiB/BaiF CoA transferase family protein [Chloroflexota bacterium]